MPKTVFKQPSKKSTNNVTNISPQPSNNNKKPKPVTVFKTKSTSNQPVTTIINDNTTDNVVEEPKQKTHFYSEPITVPAYSVAPKMSSTRDPIEPTSKKNDDTQPNTKSTFTTIETSDDNWGTLTAIRRKGNRSIKPVSTEPPVVPSAPKPKPTKPTTIFKQPSNVPKSINTPKVNAVPISSNDDVIILDKEGLSLLINTLVSELSENFVTKKEVQHIVESTLQQMVMSEANKNKRGK